MSRPLVFRILMAAVGIGVAFWAYGLLNAAQPPRTVGIGQPIRQDDFLYTVVGISKAKSVGAGETRALAHGTFYVVIVEVANKALRVDYRWDPSIVYVVDAAGRKYQFSLEAQHALDAAKPVSNIIGAGASARYQVAFDLPADVDRPALAYSNGILMGDVFDGGAYMRARVPLE